MKIYQLPNWPAASSSRLIAFLIPEDFINPYQDFIKKELNVSYQEKGADIQYHFTDALRAVFLRYKNPIQNPLESLRKQIHTAVLIANDQKVTDLFLVHFPEENPHYTYQEIVETAILSNYQFLTYKSDKEYNSLEKVGVFTTHKTEDHALETGKKIAKAVAEARDLVNEPLITLSATELSNRIQHLGEKYGFSTEVFSKKKIEALKMGGILAVNSGSLHPPTFSILEHKPTEALNTKPIVLVGKGVVYDTGGLSLKPTTNSMDFMKSDMAGAAAVIGALCAIAGLNLPLHVIGLVPATDNRPGLDAYAPGDVITMYNGTTVEIMNTDAEGRLLLADALAYAKKYDPEFVVDLATLTGAAVAAVGKENIAMMSTASYEINSQLKAAGMQVYERLVELPLWYEYGKQLDSTIADLKNLGGKYAGAITAGKFLEHFTAYPWIHLDIAGPAFLHEQDNYRGKGGSGVGVRLLVSFLSNYIKSIENNE